MTWITVLHDIPNQKRANLIEYCKKATEIDETFKFHVTAETIIIESQTKNQAYRRGSLLHHKYGCYYEVFKQNQTP